MMGWRMVIVALLSHNIYASDTQCHNKALFPSTVNSSILNSIADANLFFEILLEGLEVGEECTPFCVQDEELASMRLTRRLEDVSRNVLPTKLADIQRLTSALSQLPGSLCRVDFEHVVLTLVHTAYRMANTAGHQRDAWAESFVNLYKTVKKDLRSAA
ncbi:protein FAM180A-like [Paramormyrops kingsleyae]|uniref:Protein FAM180A-like n=1 Tax=Paramormyrops kingsleyae TaxID=1676925 RepID=A0A3B3TF08_9TELE|nr:protein FAM180A-like [Paramormyrops kingsleyae]